VYIVVVMTMNETDHFKKACILTITIVIGFVIAYELYWRGRGFIPAFNDDKVLWAAQRKEIYQSPEAATIFIGSSRSRFDIDIPTWQELTGEDAVQLAFGGTSPRPILHHLARDEQFKGKVVVDIAEQIFFFVDSVRGERAAQEAIGYYVEETPAQCVSAAINFFLESNVVLLEEGRFGLNALLGEIEMKNRPGIFARPSFPKEFSMLTFERQSKFTPMFLASPALRQAQLEARAKVIASVKTKRAEGKQLEVFLAEIKKSIDKIRSRGGEVIFIRQPSDGASLEREKSLCPREKYWDRLLKYTETKGYHFSDYQELNQFKCVDESHLSPDDAKAYTRELISIIKRDGEFLDAKAASNH
jgi:hypothetical protein